MTKFTLLLWKRCIYERVSQDTDLDTCMTWATDMWNDIQSVLGGECQ